MGGRFSLQGMVNGARGPSYWSLPMGREARALCSAAAPAHVSPPPPSAPDFGVQGHPLEAR